MLRRLLIPILVAAAAAGAAAANRAAAQTASDEPQTLDELVDFVIRGPEDPDQPSDDDIWNWGDGEPGPSALETPTGPPLAGPTPDDPIGPSLAGPAPEPSPLVVRRSRRVEPQDPFAQRGIAMGAFVIRPSIEIGASWTDNVAGGADKKSATGLVVAPEINVTSSSERYEFEANLSGEGTFYEDDSFNRQTAEARAKLRYDLSTRSSLYTEAAYSRFLEGFSDPDTPTAAAERPAVDSIEASLGFEQRFGRFSTRATGFVERAMHEAVPLAGGGTASREELDNTEFGMRVRTGLSNGATIRPFTEVAVARRAFDNHLDDSGFARSSVWGELRGGLIIDRGEKLSGEVSLGYRREDIEDDRLPDLNVALANASILWSPRRLTEVKLDLSTSVNPTSTPDTSATVLYAATLTLARNLSPRVRAEIGGGVSYEDRIGDDWRDVTFTGFAGASYAFNRMVSIEGRYQYTHTDRNEADGTYDEHEVGVRLRLQR